VKVLVTVLKAVAVAAAVAVLKAAAVAVREARRPTPAVGQSPAA
jgi:hypothetical protein